MSDLCAIAGNLSELNDLTAPMRLSFGSGQGILSPYLRKARMKKTVVFFISMLLFAAPLFAAESLLDRVKGMEIVKSLLPQTEVLEARDIGELIEVVIKDPNGAKQICYITPDGTKLIVGGAVISKDKVNLTQQRFEEVNRVDVSKLPLDDAIVIKKGSGAKKLIMFTDVDCPFCRKAYEWLKSQTGYTLYLFFSPLDMHPNSPGKTVKIFCAKNHENAIDLAQSDQDIGAEACEKGEKMLARHKAISAGIGVTGTPLFVTQTGVRITGFQPGALESYLKE